MDTYRRKYSMHRRKYSMTQVTVQSLPVTPCPTSSQHTPTLMGRSGPSSRPSTTSPSSFTWTPSIAQRPTACLSRTAVDANDGVWPFCHMSVSFATDETKQLTLLVYFSTLAVPCPIRRHSSRSLLSCHDYHDYYYNHHDYYDCDYYDGSPRRCPCPAQSGTIAPAPCSAPSSPPSPPPSATQAKQHGRPDQALLDPPFLRR